LPQFLLHTLWYRFKRIQTLRQYRESIKQLYSEATIFIDMGVAGAYASRKLGYKGSSRGTQRLLNSAGMVFVLRKH
jgi:hypothetical protein